MSFIRELHPGMGTAVAARTILRKKDDGKLETWGDVADRVAKGNSSLCTDKIHAQSEYELLKKHIGQGNILMSGRHLQHGDENQPSRNMEVFTNCAHSATSFASLYLLLNGSGVGRCFDDDICIVNWDNAPALLCVLDESHPDYNYSAHTSVRDAKHRYGSGKDVMWFEVPDSREGWAQALELWENAAFEKIHKDKILILDFSKVRCQGSPIGGMQSRPSSGPVPLMDAYTKCNTLRGAGIPPWLQALYIDHFTATAVLVGGSRRSARMAFKYWKDPGIIDFIRIKRPIEFAGKTTDEVKDYLANCKYPPMAFLWSSNNSIGVDKEFWELLDLKSGDKGYNTKDAKHAREVFDSATQASYADGTGEPGFINLDKLVDNEDGLEDYTKGDWFGSKKYQIREDTQIYLSKLGKKVKKKKYKMGVNPCAEICLFILGAFCVIADVVPYHCETIEEAEEALRVTTRALIRTNTMDSVYGSEVRRTNRIGVGFTGIHEFAWKFFGLGFRDLIDESRSQEFWNTLAKFKKIVQDEAERYSKEIGMNVPHTDTTCKPAGTTAKLFGLTEGWHLPSMREFLRYVQFRSDDPLVAVYKARGYPVRELVQYQGTTIVGFPTAPVITQLGMGDRLVTAAEATIDEQYQWLRLGEKYWIRGVDENGVELVKNTGNQISYTAKWNPRDYTYNQYQEMVRKNQASVKCASLMPQTDTSSYEYQPETSVTKAEFEQIVNNIKIEMTEDIGKEHIDCAGGACPVDFKTEK